MIVAIGSTRFAFLAYSDWPATGMNLNGGPAEEKVRTGAEIVELNLAYESGGRGFESFPARQQNQQLRRLPFFEPN